jgi:hypothetical protein
MFLRIVRVIYDFKYYLQPTRVLLLVRVLLSTLTHGRESRRKGVLVVEMREVTVKRVRHKEIRRAKRTRIKTERLKGLGHNHRSLLKALLPGALPPPPPTILLNLMSSLVFVFTSIQHKVAIAPGVLTNMRSHPRTLQAERPFGSLLSPRNCSYLLSF